MADLYYTEITFLMIIVLIIMIFIIAKNDLLSKQQKTSLTQLYLMLIWATGFEWMAVFLNGKPSNTIFLHSIVKAMEYSLVPFLCIHFLNVMDLKKENKWLLYLVGANVLLQVSSISTGWTFYIDENNVYQHGAFNWVYTVVCIFCSMYTMIKCFKYGNHFQSSSKRTSFALCMLLLSGIVLRQINREVRLELLSVTFVGIFMYIYYVDILQKSDTLTGLMNQGSYISKLSDITGKAGIVYFDINEFKEINDNYGHIYGDKVLHIVGQIIKDVYEKYGSCYRIGGDEFCVILEEKIEDIEALNAEFEQQLEENRKTEKNLPTVSLGYSVFDPEKDDIQDIVYLADKNMYRTKTKLRKALQETNLRLRTTVQAFQIAAEESSTLVFIYDLKRQSILVDERTAKAFGVAEEQEGIPYETAKMGMVSEDTVEEYIKIHEEMLKGAFQSAGIVKLKQVDGTQSTQKLSFRAVLDEDGNPTGTAVGIYRLLPEQER